MIQARDDILHDSPELIQSKIPGSFRRSPDAEQRDICILQGFRGRKTGGKAPGIDCVADDVFKPRLVERRQATLDVVNFVRVRIDSDDGMVQVSEAGSRDAAYISESEHSNPGGVVGLFHFTILTAPLRSRR